MPAELTVGPPVLTINQGNTFMVTDLNGEIAANSELGVFSNDTRFVSYYALFANGICLKRVSSSAITYYSSRIYLTNPSFETEQGSIRENTLSVVITREVSDGVSERIDISNFSQKSVHFNFEISIRSDFADIFEVRSHNFVRRGRVQTRWENDRILIASYSNLDFHRHCVYRLVSCSSEAHMANGRLTFEIELPAGAQWFVDSWYELVFTEVLPEFSDKDKGEVNDLLRLQNAWQERATHLVSANEEIYRLFYQSVEDMGAMRLNANQSSPDVWIPSAGVPWYVTLFGRDSLIASLQNMSVNPRFALGALASLAQHQATEIDDYRDAEPGKIMHEIRFGELAHFKRIPHTPYYGTADATALYLITLHEAWKWLGDPGILHKYKDAALRCLEWIDNYGDLDGDGFQEYRRRAPTGYENTVWKDSEDSIIYPDGGNVLQPKAVCELQGYVFDAWMRMAEIFDFLGDNVRAYELRTKAKNLHQNFNDKYWLEDQSCFALTLDSQKQAVKTAASNAGHLLWSGISTQEHAEKLVGRLMQEDFFSGWGIRTLPSSHAAFNPHSYHCGSVWPHDNGIIAMGFKRYGHADQVARVARDISEAASHFVSHRLPELYAGIQRQAGTFPVQYTSANVPQAWAAGSVFHLIQALLGIQADAPNRKLYVDPHLPGWLPDVALSNMVVGNSSLSLKFWRQGGESRFDATVSGGDITVAQKKWLPWDVSKV